LTDYFFDGQGAPHGAQAPAKSSGDTAPPLEGLDKWSTRMAATPSSTTMAKTERKFLLAR
jgi:hypothetical protein